MKMLFFVIFLLSVDAYSADDHEGGHAFSRIFNSETWPDIHEVYTLGGAGKQRVVSVDTAMSYHKRGKVIIKDSEQNASLFFAVEMLREASEVMQTSVRYGETVVSQILITSSAMDPPDLSEPGGGVGSIDIILQDDFFLWRPAIPYPEFPLRPYVGGMINGDASHIEFTQYLFCSCDPEKGFFVRIVVPYSPPGQSEVIWGQERYGGFHAYGEDAAIEVCQRKSVSLREEAGTLYTPLKKN